MLYVFGIIVGYLLGSVPFGLVLTRIAGRGDLRRVGSGNIGAANVMRVGGLRMAGLVWILDMAKAIAAVFIGNAIGGEAFGAMCGLAAVVGHCFPIWLRFHGGKGVSCLFGVLIAINPIIFLFCGIEWLIVALSFGYSSLAGLVVFCVAPVFGFAVGFWVGVALSVISVICIWRQGRRGQGCPQCRKQNDEGCGQNNAKKACITQSFSFDTRRRQNGVIATKHE